MNTNNNNCTTCSSSKVYIQKNAKYVKNGCSLDWIDSDALRHKFGPDYCDGLRRDRWFPSWLIEYCPEETKPGDLGYPDPCDKNVYYQLVGGIVYRVEFDCNLKEISRDAIKKYKIQDCAIESLSASKIINRCDFFKNTTLVKPLEDYKTVINGVKTVSPLYQFLDVILTDDCELKVAYDNRLARRAVLPALKCIVDYDIASDTTKVNLANVIDNKTIRIKSVTGAGCDTIYSYTYTQDNIEGDGTDISPLIAKVKVQDNIEGDGTSANRLIAKVKVDGTSVTGNGTNVNPLKSKTYVDLNQFSGDGQSPATQYSIKPCTIPNNTFTVTAKDISISNPLGTGTNFRTEQVSLSKRFKANSNWSINDLPIPCAGKKILAQLTITIVSNLNILTYPVHLAGNAVLTGGSFLAGGTGAKMPGFQVPRGIAADYGDSRGTTNTITHLVLLDGNSATINFETEVDFPNNVDPNTTAPVNPFNNNTLTKNDYFESLSAQLVVLGVF